MTPHFTRQEFEFSGTAVRLRIGNQVPDALMPNAVATLEMMERIRAALSEKAGRDVPIRITSGYRSLNVNRAVGSKDTSDHVQANATDWQAPAFGTPLEICRFLAPRVGELGIGQLIHEYGRWVHTSTRVPSNDWNRVITATHAGMRTGIVEA